MLPARIFRNRWESIPPRSKIEADGKQASPHLIIRSLFAAPANAAAILK